MWSQTTHQTMESTRQVTCPGCDALWYEIGRREDGRWTFIEDSGPVDPEGKPAIECPDCGRTFELVTTATRRRSLV